MLNYNILLYKPKIKINDEIGLDLLYKSLLKNLDENNLSGSFLYVNEYYIARPDLISLAVYGDDKYGDILCKLNGISNPFELNEGNILFIPSIETISNIIDNKNNIQYSERITDTENISTGNKIGAQKEKNEKRSPSQQIIGDQNYVIDKSLGIVFY